jgi:serine/threonine protein phosphatase PrpC
MASVRGTPTPRQLIIGVRDDTGMVRSNNEDNHCALLPPNTPVGVGGILAVADGVGGHDGGEIASQIAIDGVANLLGRAAGPKNINDVDPAALLHRAIVDINRQVFHAAVERQGRSAMATTLSIALVTGSTLWMGHVGDSRVYLYRDNVLEQLTPDHSWVAEEVARGAMTPEEAATDRRRNLLTRAVGTAEDVEPATLKMELLPGDTVLLCSDGLYGLVSDEHIAAVLESKTPEEAADILIEMANTAGGTDNITAIVARILTIEHLPGSVWSEDCASDTIISSGSNGDDSGASQRRPIRSIWTGIRVIGRLLWRGKL